MSMRFNGLMATIVPTSTKSKDKLKLAVLGWANGVSDSDPDMGWFAFFADTRDGEFGVIYSDRLRGDLAGMGDLWYVQMVAPKVEIDTDDDNAVVVGEDVIIEQQHSLSDAQWLVLVEKALAGDVLMMRIVSLLSENLQYSEALATAVAGVLLPKMLPQVIGSLWEKAEPVMLARLGKLISSSNELIEGDGGMSDAQIKAAVDAALPSLLSATLSEQLPGMMDDAMKRVLPSFLPNWSGLAEQALSQFIAEQKRLVEENTVKAEKAFGDSLAEIKKALTDEQSEISQKYRAALHDLGDMAEIKSQVLDNKKDADEALSIANANGQQLAKNMSLLQGIQQQVTDNIEKDKVQQLELGELLINTRQQFEVIAANQVRITKSADDIKAFDEWVVKVKSSFERLDYFLLNEYDNLIAELQKSGADVEQINDIQDKVLSISGEADRISDAFKLFETKLEQAEESDEIALLRGDIKVVSDALEKLGSKVTVSQPAEAVVAEVVEEPEELDEMSDPAGMM